MKLKTDTNWKIILTTRRLLVESVALFVVAGIILAFAIIPQVMAIYDLQTKVNKQRPVVETLTTKLANLEQVEVSEDFFNAGLVNSSLPSKKPLMELLLSLQSSADLSGAQIVNFEVAPGDLATGSAQPRPTQRKGSTDYDYLELNVELEGTLSSVQSFLTRVEQFTPFATISSVSIEAPQTLQISSDGEERYLTAMLKIRTYYFTKTVQSSVESVLPKITDRDREVLLELAKLQNITVQESQNIEGGGNEKLFGDVDKLFE